MARKINEQTGFPEYNLGDIKGVFSNALSNFDWGGPLRNMMSKGGSEGETQADTSPREFAKTFDPTSNTDVMKLQGMIGVKEDGVLGPKTLTALRQLQSGQNYMSEESQKADFTKSVDAGLMSPEEADILGVAYANTGSSEEVEMGDSVYNPTPMESFLDQQTYQPYGRIERDSIQNRFMQEPVYAQQMSGMGRLDRRSIADYFPDTDMSVFEDAMKNQNLGDYTELDMDSGAPSTLSGVNSYDPRFMQTPKESRSALRDIINKALNVTTRK